MLCLNFHHLGIRGRFVLSDFNLRDSLMELEVSSVRLFGNTFSQSEANLQVSDLRLALLSPERGRVEGVEQRVDFFPCTAAPLPELEHGGFVLGVRQRQGNSCLLLRVLNGGGRLLCNGLFLLQSMSAGPPQLPLELNDLTFQVADLATRRAWSDRVDPRREASRGRRHIARCRPRSVNRVPLWSRRPLAASFAEGSIRLRFILRLQEAIELRFSAALRTRRIRHWRWAGVSHRTQCWR